MCGAPGANDWADFGSIDFFLTYVFHVLVKRNVWHLRRKLCAFLQGNEMSERVEIIPSIPVENKTKIILNMTEYLLTPD